MTEHPHQCPQPVELPVDERESALPLPAQLTRFIITGGFSAIVDFGLLVILMGLGLGHTPAKAISFIAGTTTAYLINRRWTFNAAPSRARFIAVVILYATLAPSPAHPRWLPAWASHFLMFTGLGLPTALWYATSEGARRSPQRVRAMAEL